MKESELNTIIKNNFETAGGFAHKLPDPMFTTDDDQRFNLKRPFDGFAVFNSNQYYYETKLLRGYRAFRYQQLTEHQIDNLTLIQKNSDYATPLIIVGIYLFRKGVDLFFFEPNKISWDKKVSIPKRQFEIFKDKGYCLEVRKKWFDIRKINEKIIRDKNCWWEK